MIVKEMRQIDSLSSDDDGSVCDVCCSVRYVKVAASTLGPASFNYCLDCIDQNAEPFMMVATSIFVAGGPFAANLENLANVATFRNGRYVGIEAVLAEYGKLEEDIRSQFFEVDVSP